MKKILLYYKYVRIEQPTAFTASQLQLCEQLGLKGRVRIGEEGINGTLGGSECAIDNYVEKMSADSRFAGIDWKISFHEALGFDELLVKEVDEIISSAGLLKGASIDDFGATHLSPAQFHEKCKADGSLLLDVRNSYEVAVGHFEGAVDPQLRRFGMFPEWVQENSMLFAEKKQILMYCTGGIRCEKASAFVRKHLADKGCADVDVFQLQGGIHRWDASLLV
jgi:UPF0176 protein